MTASALNSASVSPNAPHGQGLAASGRAGAPSGLAGFDALLTALFPQTAQMPAPARMGEGGEAPPAVGEGGLTLDAKPKDDAAESEDAPAAGSAASDASAAALAAALAAPAPAAQPGTPAPAADAAPAWGRDKAKGAPASPALQNANAQAALASKAADAEAEADTPDATSRPAESANATDALTAARPAATTEPKARAPLANAPPTTAPAPAPTSADAAEPSPAPQGSAPAPEGPAPTAAANAAAASIQAASAPAGRPEAPAPVRPVRAERGKAAASDREPDPSTPLAPTGASAAKAAASGAAPTPSAAAGPEPDPVAPDAGADSHEAVHAESPDPTVPADLRSPTAASAPVAHAAHVVRGSPETVAHLAAQIAKKLDGQSTRFDVELNPQGLGKVDVRVEIGASGQISAAMLFDNPQAAQDVKARAAELQRMLEQAGFNLAGGLSFDVASDTGQQGRAWRDDADTGRGDRGQAFRAALETAGQADAAAQGPLRLRQGVNAGLDVRI